jgi:hypothetical protein
MLNCPSTEDGDTNNLTNNLNSLAMGVNVYEDDSLEVDGLIKEDVVAT